MDKKFSLKNFIIKEAEDEMSIKKNNSEEIQLKDTQYSSQINKEEEDDSYGIPSDNDTEKNNSKQISKELATHRLVLQKEIGKEETKKIQNKNENLKRKRKPVIEKKDNRKRIVEHIKKNINKMQATLGIINGKLNIGFAENKENKNLNDENKKEKTPEKKFQDEEDEEIDRLKMSNERKKIENVNKKNNNDFIKRMKENENFIKNNNIIIEEGGDIGKENNLKGNKSNLGLNKKNIPAHPKLKLYSFKGAFLNKNKK